MNTEMYSRGRRGAPAKGVGRLSRRESSNLSISAKQKDTKRCPFCFGGRDLNYFSADLRSKRRGLEHERRRGRIKRVRQGRKQGVSEASPAERTETTMFSSGKKKCNAFRYLTPSPTNKNHNSYTKRLRFLYCYDIILSNKIFWRKVK